MSGLSVRLSLGRAARGSAAFTLDVAIEAPAGITVVYGPSGAGKSTLLMSILGALRADRGTVRIGERTLFDSDRSVDVPIHARRIGMVFQDALLFPHLDALANVSFGLHGADANRRAMELLEQVGGARLAGRRPHDLSGGERQRVALARSLAADPQALLLDEPFSALDVPARERLGRLLSELQAERKIPFLHVTHDLDEAMRLGHHLVLLDAGRVIQAGLPVDVVARPDSVAAARAIGTANRFSATVIEHAADPGCTRVDLGGTTVQTGRLDLRGGERIALGLRAEDILLSLDPLRRTSARNIIRGTIQELAPRDGGIEVRVTTPVSFRAMVTQASVDELELRPGTDVYLVIKAAAFHRLV